MAKIDVNLVIGGKENIKEYIFSKILDIKIDSKNNIYVSDKLKPQLSIYDTKGKFLRNIGARGKGPGEFLEITTYDIIADEVIVFDKINQRFTVFSSEDDFKTFTSSSQNLNGYFVASKIFKDDQHYHIYSYDNRLKTKTEYLLHKFDTNFKYKETSFIENNKIWNTRNKFESVQAAMGSIDILKIQKNYFIAPDVYLGYIFQAKKLTEESYEIHKIKSKNPEIDSYKIYPSSIENLGIPNSVAYNGMEGKTIYKVRNRSIGLHKWKNYIINFILMEKKEQLILSFNLFDIEGKYLGHYEILNFELEGKPIFNYEIPTIDNDDNFYLIENLDVPKIKRFRLTIN